jgi:hypothetical protein
MRGRPWIGSLSSAETWEVVPSAILDLVYCIYKHVVKSLYYSALGLAAQAWQVVKS